MSRITHHTLHIACEIVSFTKYIGSIVVEHFSHLLKLIPNKFMKCFFNGNNCIDNTYA